MGRSVSSEYLDGRHRVVGGPLVGLLFLMVRVAHRLLLEHSLRKTINCVTPRLKTFKANEIQLECLQTGRLRISIRPASLVTGQPNPPPRQDFSCPSSTTDRTSWRSTNVRGFDMIAKLLAGGTALHAAEDMTQGAMVVAYEKWSDQLCAWPYERQLAYVRGVVKNKIVDDLRRGIRWRDIERVLARRQKAAFTHVESDVLASDVVAAIWKLRGRKRDVASLRDLERRTQARAVLGSGRTTGRHPSLSSRPSGWPRWCWSWPCGLWPYCS